MRTMTIDKTEEHDNQAAEIFQKIFHRQPKSSMDMIEMSREGVTKGALMSFARYFRMTPDKVAHMLPITLRTIQRYSNRQKFNAVVSEHILQLALLMAKGVEVFGSQELFRNWFDAPSAALGGKAPRDLVSLKTGAQLVMDELGRIEYGVFA